MNPYLDILDGKLLPRWNEIRADGKITMFELWDSRGDVLSAVTATMREAAVFDVADKAYLLDAFNQLFARWVKPVDIPWIREPFEGFLKEQLRSWLYNLISEHIDAEIAKGDVVGSALPPAE